MAGPWTLHSSRKRLTRIFLLSAQTWRAERPVPWLQDVHPGTGLQKRSLANQESSMLSNPRIGPALCNCAPMLASGLAREYGAASRRHTNSISIDTSDMSIPGFGRDDHSQMCVEGIPVKASQSRRPEQVTGSAFSSHGHLQLRFKRMFDDLGGYPSGEAQWTDGAGDTW